MLLWIRSVGARRIFFPGEGNWWRAEAGWSSWKGAASPSPPAKGSGGTQIDFFVQFLTSNGYDFCPWFPVYKLRSGNNFLKHWLPNPKSGWRVRHQLVLLQNTSTTTYIFFYSVQKWNSRCWTIIHGLPTRRISVAAVQTDSGDGVFLHDNTFQLFHGRVSAPAPLSMPVGAHDSFGRRGKRIADILCLSQLLILLTYLLTSEFFVDPIRNENHQSGQRL